MLGRHPPDLGIARFGLCGSLPRGDHELELQAPATDVPQLKFKVGRPAGGDNFTIIGESEVVTPVAGTLSTYPVQIAVQAGDVIGLFTDDGPCGRESSGYTTHSESGDVPPGTEATFFRGEGFQLDVSAVLEPDCDSDGLGDETQDTDLSACFPPSPPAPEQVTCLGKRATIVGTPNRDTIRGTPGRDVIVALAGKDTVVGRKGKDIICGNRGSDRIFGSAGNDKLIGGAKKDQLFGARGRDFLKGKAGRDFLNGGRKRDRLLGGKGFDRCKGKQGRDKAKGCAQELGIP